METECSDDDLVADGVAVPSVSQSLGTMTHQRVGPRSLSEVFMWGEFYLGAIFQSPYWGNLLSTAFKGFNLITDYSGMGCPEMSFRMIQEALVKMGFVDEAFKLHHAVRALDIKPLCRRVLRAHSDAPTHVMSDIMQRIPVPTREELIALARHAQARLKELEASSGGKVSKDARDMMGEEMIYSAGNVLTRVQSFHGSEAVV